MPAKHCVCEGERTTRTLPNEDEENSERSLKKQKTANI